jgi:hypothetical protein
VATNAHGPGRRGAATAGGEVRVGARPRLSLCRDEQSSGTAVLPAARSGQGGGPATESRVGVPGVGLGGAGAGGGADLRDVGEGRGERGCDRATGPPDRVRAPDPRCSPSVLRCHVSHPDRDRLRDELIRGYLPVARHIARKYGHRLENLEDLQQVASVGLVLAVDRTGGARDLGGPMAPSRAMSRAADLAFVRRAAELWDQDDPEIGHHPRLFCQLVLPTRTLATCRSGAGATATAR